MAAVRAFSSIRRLPGRRCMQLRKLRYLSVEAAMAAPTGTAAGENGKSYPENIINIVDQISQLTLIETAELNELLKIRLKIPDAPMMAMGAMAMGQPADTGAPVEEAKEEQTEFSVKLTGFDDGGKVKLIKEVKSLTEGLNLVQAKKFVESVPQVMKEGVSKEEAEKLKTQLEAVGGKVEIE